jgi:hypothetical protein
MNILYYGVPAYAEGGHIVVRFMDRSDAKDMGTDLPLRDDLAQHAERFDWGKPMIAGRESKALTAGAAQLALAICAHALANDRRALALFQRFKHRVVTKWKVGEAWAVTADEVAATCDLIEAEQLSPSELGKIVKDGEAEARQVEHETGRGVEREIVWDTDEGGNRIRPRGAD